MELRWNIEVEKDQGNRKVDDEETHRQEEQLDELPSGETGAIAGKGSRKRASMLAQSNNCQNFNCG